MEFKGLLALRPPARNSAILETRAGGFCLYNCGFQPPSLTPQLEPKSTWEMEFKGLLALRPPARNSAILETRAGGFCLYNCGFQPPSLTPQLEPKSTW